MLYRTLRPGPAAIMFASLSVLIGGFLPVSAAVVYVDVPDAPATYDGIYLPLGSAATLTVYRSSGSGSGEVLDWTFSGSGDGSASIAFRPGSTIQALGLDAGQPIGKTLNWRGGDGYLVLTRCTIKPPTTCQDEGDWAGRVRYLGVLFREAGGTNHYGWIRLAHYPAGGGGYAPVYLLDYAYETTPETPLLAGSRNTLATDLLRALRLAAGHLKASSADLTLLDRAGAPGRVDVADAVVLARVLGGLT